MIELRIILALAMFAIASYTDLKERKSYDVVPICFGIIGTILYFFDWQEFNGFDYFALILNLVALVALCKTNMAKGDLFLAISLSVIIPSIGPIPTGIAIWIFGIIGGQIIGYILCYSRNKQELKNNPDLFEEFVIESKTLLKFKCHKNNNHNFVTLIEENVMSGKKIKTIDVSDDTLEMKAKQGQFVRPLIPGVPIMMTVFSLVMVFHHFKIF